MAVWSGTKYFVTPDGSNDLMLDEGAGFGYFISDDFTISTALGYHVIHCRLQVAQDGGGNPDISKIKIYIATSEDDATYTDWIDFWPNPVTAYCKYYRYKITFESHLNTVNLPKITACETIAKPLQSQSRQESINAIMATAPAAPDLGAGYLVTTGADADKIHRCIDSDTPTYQKIPMDEGMDVWDRGTKQRVIYSNSKQGKPYCLQGLKPIATDIRIACAGAMTTIITKSFTAGDYDEAIDKFYINIAMYTGDAGATQDRIYIDFYDPGLGAWNNIYDSGAGTFGPAVYVELTVKIVACPTVNTASLAQPSVGALQRTAGLPADWIGTGSGIRVRAQGDANAKASATMFVMRNV